MRLLAILTMIPLLGLAQPAGKGSPRAAASAKPEPAPQKWPLVSLAVEGNRHYSSEQILAVAGLKIGQLAGKDEFEAARNRLSASGFFEMVGYKFDPAPNRQAITGTFQVTEIDAAYPARFEGLGVPAQELEKMLRSGDPLFSPDKVPPTKTVLDRYVSWIQEYLASKGSHEKVAARLNPTGTDSFEIVFRPARNLPVISQVTFEGSSAVPQSVLRDAISGVAVGSPYTEEHFRQLLNTSVRPVYEARGRLRVSFAKIRTEPAPDVQGLHVFVTVSEGDVYQLGKVALAGPSPVKPEDLLKAGNFPSGQIANFDQVNESLERMRKTLLHAGFMEAKVTADRRIDDTNKLVDLVINVDSGPQFQMGKLNIAGLDLDGEAEIRRLWAIKEGKPFNADYPQLFLDRIREQGLFDNLGKTKSELKINGQDHTVDVTLTFTGEAPNRNGTRPGDFQR